MDRNSVPRLRLLPSSRTELWENFEVKSLAAVAAALIPVVPKGRQARTTLCCPIRPKAYLLCRYLYRSQLPVEDLDAGPPWRLFI